MSCVRTNETELDRSKGGSLVHRNLQWNDDETENGIDEAAGGEGHEGHRKQPRCVVPKCDATLLLLNREEDHPWQAFAAFVGSAQRRLQDHTAQLYETGEALAHARRR